MKLLLKIVSPSKTLVKKHLLIKEYEKLLDSSNINQINTLEFHYLVNLSEDFKTDIKHLYVFLSNLTHAISHQLMERLNRNSTGRTMGFEGTQELRELNNTIEKLYSVLIVLIFQSVGQYVPGDFLV